MEYKLLGKTKEQIPVLGIGTWNMLSDKGDTEAIRAAVEYGMTLVDTAEMYGNEDIVGKAIRGLDVFIATKVSPHNFRYEDVIKACNASLQRLGTKQIDLYQLHWPNHSVPIAETMRAMEWLKNDGKIRHIGVSNFDINEFEGAQASLKNSEIVSNQVEYSMLVRDVENGLLDYCGKNRVTLMAYSPLAHGSLYTEKYKELRGLLSSIGLRHKKSITQVALNWLISKEPVVCIPKASDKEHVIEDAGASGWSMSPAELSEISSFLPGVRKRPLVPSAFAPLVKHSGFWSKHLQSRNAKRRPA